MYKSFLMKNRDLFSVQLYAVTRSIHGEYFDFIISLVYHQVFLRFLMPFFFVLFLCIRILQAIFQSSLSLVCMVMALNVSGGIPSAEVSMSFAVWHQKMSLFTGNMLTAVELELTIEAFEKGTFRMVQCIIVVVDVTIINPRGMRRRVIEVVWSVCMCVCLCVCVLLLIWKSMQIGVK